MKPEVIVYVKKLDREFPLQRMNIDVETVEVDMDNGDLWEFDFDEVTLRAKINGKWTEFELGGENEKN